jgi:hypothetical protein
MVDEAHVTTFACCRLAPQGRRARRCSPLGVAGGRGARPDARGAALQRPSAHALSTFRPGRVSAALLLDNGENALIIHRSSHSPQMERAWPRCALARGRGGPPTAFPTAGPTASHSSDRRPDPAIETSCDETAVAVVEHGRASCRRGGEQVAHAETGGIVPEVAARAHLRWMFRSWTRAPPALKGSASCHRGDRGSGPGSLLVGITMARTRLMHDLPLVPSATTKATCTPRGAGPDETEHPARRLHRPRGEQLDTFLVLIRDHPTSPSGRHGG